MQQRLFISVSAAFITLSTLACSQTFPIATPQSQGLDPKQIDRLDQNVQKYVDQQSIVGGELLVIKNRNTVFHKAYGFRDKEDKEKMENGTIFNIRSMTKPFTGAALQMLIEQGKVGIDDPVSKYLPELDTDTAKTLTIRQILTHRSGLPLTVLTQLNQYKNLKEIMEAAGKAKLEFKPGEKFFYSDAGADCVAAVVEKVSGETIDKFVTEHLFRPLNMTNAFYVWDDSKKDRLASVYSGTRGQWSRIWDAKKPFYPFAWGSQTAYCTAEDYAKFLAMWMDNGLSNGKRILSEETLKRGLSPISEMYTVGGGARMPTGFFDLGTYYGEMSVLWFKQPMKEGDKPVVIGHSGSDGTFAWAWPDEDLIVCFFTQSRGGSGVLRLETVIDATLRGKDTVPVPDKLKPYLGTYLANFGTFQNEEFSIEFVNGKFIIGIPSQLNFVLDGPNKDGNYDIVGASGQSISFSEPKDGKSATLYLHAGNVKLELPRGSAADVKVEPIKLEDVKQFLGKYQAPEDKSIIEIILKEGTLMVHVPSANMDVPLSPVKDQHNVWILGGTTAVVFNEEDGKVVSLTLNMPDGTKLKRTKIKD